MICPVFIYGFLMAISIKQNKSIRALAAMAATRSCLWYQLLHTTLRRQQ